jgi:hypothetical protein
MKINVDMDITPEEVRKLFGLPDVEGFQRQLMDDIRERMMTGAEGYDPLKLFQPYLTGTLAGWDMFQKLLTGAAATATQSPSKSGSEKS